MSAPLNKRPLRPGQDPLGYKDKPARRRRRNRGNRSGMRTFGAIMLKGVLPLCVVWWAFSPMFTNATGADVVAEEASAETPVDCVVVVTDPDKAPVAETPVVVKVDTPAKESEAPEPVAARPEPTVRTQQPEAEAAHVESLDEISAEIAPETVVEIPADAPEIETPEAVNP